MTSFKLNKTTQFKVAHNSHGIKHINCLCLIDYEQNETQTHKFNIQLNLTIKKYNVKSNIFHELLLERM